VPKNLPPAEPPPERTVETARESESDVAGGLDPKQGAFSLRRKENRTRHLRYDDLKPFDFSGFQIAASGNQPEVLIGQLGERSNELNFIVLTRPDSADKLLLDEVRRALLYQIDTAALRNRVPPETLAVYKKVGGYDQPGENNPFYRSLSAWRSRLQTEYPETDFYRVDSGIYGVCAANLFEDHYFAQHFGKSYFDVTEAESIWLGNSMNTDRSPDKRWKEAVQDNGFLSRAFTLTVGNMGRIETTSRLLGLRELRRFRAQLLERLQTMDPAFDALDRIASWQALAERQLKPLWPSEQGELTDAVGEARTRIAAPSLELTAAAIIRDAEGLDGARQLADWEPLHSEQLKWMSTADRSRIVGWINSRLSVLAAEFAAELRPEIERFGDSLETLPEMARWHGDVVSRYGMVFESEPFRALGERFRERRAVLLSTLESQLRDLITEQKTVGGVNGLLQKYLSMPGDRQAKAGAALVKRATDRKGEIDKALKDAMYSKREHEWKEKGLPAVVATGPTAEEMRLAVLREIAALGGEMVDSHTAHATYPMMLRTGLYMIVRVDDVKPLGSPVAERGGFRCTWQPAVKIKLSEEFERGLAKGGSGTIVKLLTEMANQTSNAGGRKVDDLFIPTRDGWRCPTALDRGLQGMFGGGK
jgi:hypothetical protein